MSIGAETDAEPAASDPASGFEPRTPLQEAIVEHKRKYPSASSREIADDLGCSKSYVSTILGGGIRYYRKERREDLCETARVVLTAAELFPHATQAEIAYLAGCSQAFVSRTLIANSHLIGETDGEDADDPDPDD